MSQELEVPSPSSEVLTVGCQIRLSAEFLGGSASGSGGVPGEAGSPPELMKGFTSIVP